MAVTQRHEQELIRKSQKAAETEADPLELLRLKCLSRGASGIKGLSRQFRIIDDDGSKSLSYDEFAKGLKDFGLGLESHEFEDKPRKQGMLVIIDCLKTNLVIKALFVKFDTDGNGTISFDEFLIKLRPPMSKTRTDIIDRAFRKMDKTGDGRITVDDLKGVYNGKNHRKFVNGEWTEEQVFLEYLKTFDSPNDPDGIVTHEEFVNYYSGLSASVDSDAYFDLMIRQAWSI